MKIFRFLSIPSNVKLPKFPGAMLAFITRILNRDYSADDSSHNKGNNSMSMRSLVSIFLKENVSTMSNSSSKENPKELPKKQQRTQNLDTSSARGGGCDSDASPKDKC